MSTTSEKVQQFLRDNPDIRNSMNIGIINQSALARHIMHEMSIENFDAVLAALKRYDYKDPYPLKKEVLKKSNLEMVSGLSIIVIKRTYNNLKIITNIILNNKRLNSVKIVDTSDGIALIAEDVIASEIMKYVPDEQILKVDTNLGELIINSPEAIEKATGYINYITSLLSDINILQIISFYNDTIIILDQKNLTDAFKIISSKIGE
ncbi:hypothetical protein [Acidiplasma sp.]|uniref:hypothetical protein n=1 Tax=Acidiplasma sp. TaxID=1872114 RepID=UPI003160F346